jgi:hypothetical protein
MTQGQNPPQPKPDLNDDLGRLDNAWERVAPFLPFAAGAGSAWLHPSVDVGNGWIGVFLSTLAFSLGCALCVGLLNGSRLTGWPLAGAAGLCFVGSIIIAGAIGMGTMDPALIASTAPADNPVGFIMGVVSAAILTFGVVGAILGGATGAYLGYVAAKHLKHQRA